jgi:VWFA-related protein
VLVDVTVTDKDLPVRGLKAENFVLEDSGKKQTIALFDVTESSTLRTSGAALPAGVASNKLNAKGELQSTASVLLYDRINSNVQDQAFVRKQILGVLAGLKDSDRLGFYSIGLQGLQIVNDYDEDAALLAKAAKAMVVSDTVPVDFNAAEKMMFNALFQSLTPTQEMANQARVNVTYPAFQSIGRHLGGVLGRKNLMWITSAFPLTYGNQQERRQDDQREVEKFTRYMTENNVAVFPIDPSGTGTTDMTSQAGLGQTTGSSFANRGGAPQANEGAILAAEGNALRNAEGTGAINQTESSLNGSQSMLIVADATGGKAFRNVNDISPALREVISASEYTYTLGFYPDAASLNGSKRDLRVTLTKTDIKAKVTHRKQYYGWGPTTPKDQQEVADMQEVLRQGFPSTRIGLLAVAKPEAPESGKTVVNVRIAAGDLHFDYVNGKWMGDFEVAIIPEGGGTGAAKNFTPAFSDEELKTIVTNGMDISPEVIQTGAKPGVFHIAIVDKKSGLAGSLLLPYQAAATAPPAAAPAAAAETPTLILK